MFGFSFCCVLDSDIIIAWFVDYTRAAEWEMMLKTHSHCTGVDSGISRYNIDILTGHC